MSDEEIIPGPIGPDPLKLTKWKPPPKHKIAFKRNLMNLEFWTARQLQERYVTREEMIEWSMKHFDVSRSGALPYVKQAIEEMSKKGTKVE